MNGNVLKKTFCLNMIVKNEAHVIASTLEKLTQKLRFDYWVISDTGSTDNTADIIVEFFKTKCIPGEIHHDEWKDFGHNRTLALANAFDKTDYLLIFNAGDEIVGNAHLPVNDFKLDSYCLIFENSNELPHERSVIVNNRKKWKFVGVLHERLENPLGEPYSTSVVVGDFKVISSSNLSANPDKYFKRAKLLESAYAEEVLTEGKLADRYSFYCANNYFYCGKFEDAVKWYKIALSRGGSDQEKYVSCLKLYKCYKRLQSIETGDHYLVKSYYYDKERVECLYKLIVRHVREGQPMIAYTYYSLIQKHYETTFAKKNYSSKLFIDNRVADFFLPYYMIVVADGIKHINLGIKMFEIIFTKKTDGIAGWFVGNLLHNLQLFIVHVTAVEKISAGYSTHFFALCDEYFAFLKKCGYDLKQHDYIKTFADYDIPCLKRLFICAQEYMHKEENMQSAPELNATPIKIINLERRPDRKENMLTQLKQQGVTNYEFVNAVDGATLEPTNKLKMLFRDNNFNYRKGVIGCALSHMNLWEQLIADENAEYYLIFEDDLTFEPEFNAKLKKCMQIFNHHNIEYLLIGGFNITSKCSENVDDIKIIETIHDLEIHTGYGTASYIIRKSACKKLIDSIGKNGLQNAIDFIKIYVDAGVNMFHVNGYLVDAPFVLTGIVTDTDIQNNQDILDFSRRTLGSSNIVVGFHDACLSERGTAVALYDYALHNETLYNNKSVIFYKKDDVRNVKSVIEKFEKLFVCYGYRDFSEIDDIIVKEKITHFYNIKVNIRDGKLVTKCKNLVHAVFDHFPHGDRYAMVSRYLSDKFDNNLQAVPHMINLPKHNENMRQELNIPNDAFVFGRYGGEYQFDITIAHNAIKQILETDLNMYFIFANTRVFYVHPRIIYLQAIVDLRKKVKFINTCDAMIHARSDGETYGLSIGEFSSCNKPVVTTYSREFNAHIEILKDNAIIYNNEPELVDIFTNIREIVKTRTDWNAFKDYAPEKVMAKFMEVFVEEPKTVSSSTDVVLITAFLDIGRGGWNEYERHASKYINAFMKYLNYDYQMIVFIDERYAEEILQAYEKSRFKNKRFIAINESWMKQNIYAWRQYEKDNAIMQSESYKIMVKHRIERNYPENVYSKYNLINHSKIDFIHYAISQNLICDDAVVCWSDFGYFSAILHNNPMEYPVTTLDFNKFNQDRITISTRNHIDEMDKNIFYTLTRAPEKISGAFFGGPARMMSEFQKLYHECLNELYDNNVSDDDQHVYLRCIFRSPKLFEVHLLGDDWGKILVHFQKQIFDRFELVKHTISSISNGIFVEIGSHLGDLSEHILSSNDSCVLYCIDPYISYEGYDDSINNFTGDKLFENARNRLKSKYGDRVIFIRKFSKDALNELPGNIDFLYIDGNHSYKYVQEDIELYYPIVKNGGYIIGDDAVDVDDSKREADGNVHIVWSPGCEGRYGVVKAFRDFISQNNVAGKMMGNQYVIKK